MTTQTAPQPQDSRMADLRAILGPGNYRRLSRATGYQPQHISRVLQGRVGCSATAFTRIADAAGVTLDELRAFIAGGGEEDLP